MIQYIPAIIVWVLWAGGVVTGLLVMIAVLAEFNSDLVERYKVIMETRKRWKK